MNVWKRETGSKESGTKKTEGAVRRPEVENCLLGMTKVAPSQCVAKFYASSLYAAGRFLASASTPFDLDVVQDGHRRKHSPLYGSGDLDVMQVGRPLSPSTSWNNNLSVYHKRRLDIHFVM
jgi:hypothetical protein